MILETGDCNIQINGLGMLEVQNYLFSLLLTQKPSWNFSGLRLYPRGVSTALGRSQSRKPVYLTAVFTGLRRSELAALRVGRCSSEHRLTISQRACFHDQESQTGRNQFALVR